MPGNQRIGAHTAPNTESCGFQTNQNLKIPIFFENGYPQAIGWHHDDSTHLYIVSVWSTVFILASGKHWQNFQSRLDRKFAFLFVTQDWSAAPWEAAGLSDYRVFSVKPANIRVNKQLRDGHHQGHRLLLVTESGAAPQRVTTGAQPVH